ncbi:MAG TPA: CRTAC1 family protein [Verrucomicrobiae bacterium]|nr:CRTAC1 family protein [Verrucomicrobiae bacterium]
MLAVIGCSPADVERPWLEDATGQSGIQFIHDTGPTGRYLVPEQMGSGAALFDYDNDGRLDIYLVHNAGTNANRLFHQEPNGTFKDVSVGSGLDVAGYGMGVAVGDVNNDGLPEVLVTEYGAVRVFINRGSGKFMESKDSGLDNPRWATSAAFFDFNRDGWLDLVVANYLDYDPTQKCTDSKRAPEFCGPHGFPGLVTRLFQNKGGRFEDVTVASGLARSRGPALGVLCADFDGDYWPDIFLADDGRPNRLFINKRDGTFAEEAGTRGIALNALGQTAGNMGVAMGDVDGNGLFDLFVTHLAEEHHALWTQDRRGFFQDAAAGWGFTKQGWRGTGFGAAFADFDLDGDLDLAFVNGRVKRGATGGPVAPGVNPFWAPYAQRNQIFANQGREFRDISSANAAFCGQAMVGRSLAVGDLDNDGDLDLVTTSTGGPAKIYRNTAERKGHWLIVRVIDPTLGGRDAYGAEVNVHAGGHRHWRLAHPAFSYLCSNDPRVHFGLGTAASFDAIEVIWPDATKETFPGGRADRMIELRKGAR